MLIQRASLLDGSVTDIRIDTRIVEVADGLAPQPGEKVLDAGLGTVIPGLHDHHVHVHSAAAARDSVWVGPPAVRTKPDFVATLAGATTGPDGWIRAIGYHESVAGELDRAQLDAVVPRTPVRVQHRSGVLWIVNSAGLDRVGLSDHPDGRLRSEDRGLSAALLRRDVGLAELSHRLARYGVTGITDATPDLGVGDMIRLAEAHRHGELRQHIHYLAPGKRILHDDRLDLTELTQWISDRHEAEGRVALHCVTAAQLVVAIAALRSAGSRPGDRIEHAAIAPDDSLDDLVELGLTVVTQPNFVAERGDEYLTDVPADEHRELWRVASLMRAGVPVALSTDMPFGDGDPWAAMRAAVHRTTHSGAVLGADERISPREALTMFLGTAAEPTTVRTVEAGQPGDLCVLAAPPDEVLRQLDSSLVAATIIGGQQVYERPRS
jgi:predicted amidohydrolase YtcJ